MTDDLSSSTASRRSSAWNWILPAGLATLFLVSRVVSLLKLPVFIDEAIHIWWARDIQGGMVAAGFAEGRWFSMILMSLALYLPGEPLWLVRFSAVMAGLLTLVALLLIGRELFSQKTGILAMLFYLVIPYALFYDRLALADSLATPFGAWILYLSVKAIRSQWGGNSVILAFLLILAMLVKTAAIAFLVIPPLAVLFLLPRGQWKLGLQRILPAMLAGIIMLGAIYFAGLPAHQLEAKSRPLTTAGLFQAITENSLTLTNWSWHLLGPPLAISVGLMFLWSILTRPGRPVYFLLVIVFATLAPYIFFAEVLYPRYVFFAAVPLTLLLAALTSWLLEWIAGRTANKMQARAFSGLLLALLLLGPVAIDISLLTDPETTPLPEIMNWEFRSGWPAGYGTREMADYLAQEAAGTPGTLYVLQPLFWAHTNKGGVQLHLSEDSAAEFAEFGWDLESELPEIAGQLATGRRTLMIVDSTHPESVTLFDAIAPQLKMTLIWHFPKPGSSAGLELWEVIPNVPLNRSVSG